MLLPIWPESECELKPEVPLLHATGELTTDHLKARPDCRGTEANFEPKMLQMQIDEIKEGLPIDIGCYALLVCRVVGDSNFH